MIKGFTLSKSIFLFAASSFLGLYSCDDATNTAVTPPQNVIPRIYDWSFQRSEFFVNFTDIYFASETAGIFPGTAVH